MIDAGARKTAHSTLAQAGVDNVRFRSATISLEEITGATWIRVHSLLDDPLPATGTISLPQETGACGGDHPVALCLRPGEWLLFSEKATPAEVLNGIAPGMDPGMTAVTNASDSLAVFRVAGNGAPWLLSKLSGLDFLASRQQGRHCAQTKMGHIRVIVHYHQSAGTSFAFDLVFDRSYAKYLWTLLTESAAHADELSQQYGDAR